MKSLTVVKNALPCGYFLDKFTKILENYWLKIQEIVDKFPISFQLELRTYAMESEFSIRIFGKSQHPGFSKLTIELGSPRFHH